MGELDGQEVEEAGEALALSRARAAVELLSLELERRPPSWGGVRILAAGLLQIADEIDRSDGS